ncbi:hypothetical protein KSD_89300 [Ktedonobacter sp. SOSP1-85]|nr:hypothetical protein KSD_89300 [Ktedonobacter sp. SOSP1-85]
MRMTIPIIRILLIEDDEEDFILLRKHLSRILGVRYELEWETSYIHGLTRMLEDTQHDLCMLDYRLGAHNGIELLTEARERGYVRPIVLLTGATEGEIDIQALQAGADDYIDKGHLQGELLHRIIRYAIERKKAEIEREKLISEKMAVQELEKRKNEFMSMVVHEVKTPLTSIKGYAQLLNKRYKRSEDDQALQLVNRMNAQVSKLTSLLDDLLDVTRISGGMLSISEEFFPFDELVKEIVEDLQAVNEQFTLELEGESGVTIWGDRMRLGQVITNFLTNAMKYASASQRVVVKTRLSDQDVTLCVQDFGPGIAKDVQEKIFTPFFRQERPEQRSIPGLGLGLHIASEIIRQHEGHIWVESEEGLGATFCFSLPLERKKSIATQPETV